MMEEKNTETLGRELEQCRNIADLDKWFATNKINCSFYEYLEQLVKDRKITISKLADNINIAKSTIYTYDDRRKDGKYKKPQKKNIIKIAFGLHATEEELNRLLKLAGYKELYPRNECDAVIKFAIQKGLNIYELEDLLNKRKINWDLVD